MKPLTSYTCKLTNPQAAALRTWLQAHAYRFREVPYARFAAEHEKTNVVFYDSGKLVVQGKGTQEFVEFVLEPEILQEARLGYEAVLNPDLLLPRLGVDESGKGDFFGPLCIAGVYVNEAVIKSWADAGIRDSKNISSDGKVSDGGMGMMASGYSVIKADSLDAAVMMAKGCPVLKGGASITVFETFNAMGM